jgi:hypothetical protein
MTGKFDASVQEQYPEHPDHGAMKAEAQAAEHASERIVATAMAPKVEPELYQRNGIFPSAPTRVEGGSGSVQAEDEAILRDNPELVARMQRSIDARRSAKEGWQPQPREGQSVGDLSLDEWIGQAAGALSGCWVGGTGNLTFDSERASGIVKALTAHLEELFAAFVREAEARRQVADHYLREQYQAQLQHRDIPLEDRDHACGWCGEEFGRGAEALAKGKEHVLSQHRQTQPALGLATTRQLLEELECRFRIIEELPLRAERMQDMLDQLSDKTLDYRTVDS